MMTFDNWYIFFREWKNGPTTSVVKAFQVKFWRNGLRKVRLQPYFWQRTSGEIGIALITGLIYALLS